MEYFVVKLYMTKADEIALYLFNFPVNPNKKRHESQ